MEEKRRGAGTITGAIKKTNNILEIDRSFGM